MVAVKLYVEGGGDSKPLKTACRRGFRLFLEKAGVAGRMPRIVACGGRDTAFDRFKSGNEDKSVRAILLVDAEGPVRAGSTWEHLRQRDGWRRPRGASDEQCHLMVQVMESWFLADAETLEVYFGGGFNSGSLPKNPNVEQVAKGDVERGLERATRGTSKGGYRKGRDGFEILANLDPVRVTKALPYAKRFVEALL